MSASAITSSMHKTWPSAGSPKTTKFLSKSKGHRLQNGYLRYRIVTLSRGTIVDHCHHYKDVLIDREVWTLPWLVVCSNRAVGEGGSRFVRMRITRRPERPKRLDFPRYILPLFLFGTWSWYGSGMGTPLGRDLWSSRVNQTHNGKCGGTVKYLTI